MINIEKGRYWDLPWSLISGCTPSSPGSDHCWSAGISHHYYREGEFGHSTPIYTNNAGNFNGIVVHNQDRLSIPLKRKKPTVYAIWNDLYHKDVPGSFIVAAYKTMIQAKQHTFLILTKRAEIMAYSLSPENCFARPDFSNIWHGLTICNQAEADEKIPIFLQVPGKKFLSIEPMLGPIDLTIYCDQIGHEHPAWIRQIDCVVCGGETGPGARPMHPDWVRSIRDQCQGAGVPFFFKQWGLWKPMGEHYSGKVDGCWVNGKFWRGVGSMVAGDFNMKRNNDVYRLLDGRLHNDLPWVKS